MSDEAISRHLISLDRVDRDLHTALRLPEGLHCAFCKRYGATLQHGYHTDLLLEDKHSSIAADNDFIGPFYVNNNDKQQPPLFVHRQCAIWAPQVFIDAKLNIRNVQEEIQRSQYLRCSHCKKSGAPIGCFRETCTKSYHLPCAKETLCFLDYEKFILVCKHCFVEFMYKQFPQICGKDNMSAKEKFDLMSAWRDNFKQKESQPFDLSSIGVVGLEEYFEEIKQSLLLPLIYPDLFSKVGIKPARGIILYGAPGCGKTHLVRSLFTFLEESNFLYKGRSIRVFSHCASDLLSKFYGETERNIRDLFIKAREAQPSIIFFDEFDALAPVRSSKQMQIHSSLVSTLLSLMDGIDDAGKIFVIAATNRIDRIDPALRRPGRFDKEIHIQHLSKENRARVFVSMTQPWILGHSAEFSKEFASDFSSKKCHGFSCADLRAICVEAVFHAVNRQYPGYNVNVDKISKHTLKRVRVFEEDIESALGIIMSRGCRNSTQDSKNVAHLMFNPSHPELKPLYDRVESRMRDLFGYVMCPPGSVSHLQNVPNFLLLHGSQNCCQNELAQLVINDMMEDFCDSVFVVSSDIQEMVSTGEKDVSDVWERTPEETFFFRFMDKIKEFKETVLHPLRNAMKPCGRVLHIKNLDLIWRCLDKGCRVAVECELKDLSSYMHCRSAVNLENCLVLVTVNEIWSASLAMKLEVPSAIMQLFPFNNKFLCRPLPKEVPTLQKADVQDDDHKMDVSVQ